MTLYDFSLEKPDGTVVSLEDYKGKVVMIVNTATGCGFTPQYEDLEALYAANKDKGFEIIDIPCNQFLNQAPGTDEEIHQFCKLNYNTDFDRYKKSDVNGENQLPLYAWLKTQQGFGGLKGEMEPILDEIIVKTDPDYKNNPDIKWNFTKFIADREGNIVKRFEPTDDMADVKVFVEELL